MNNRNGVLPRDEKRLREQRAHDLGASDANHLRLIADDIEEEGIFELPGVDADRLRLLAAKLETDDDEDKDEIIAGLREHGHNVHRALCEAIEDLDKAERPVVAVFVTSKNVFETLDALTPEQFSDLAIYLLDEVE